MLANVHARLTCTTQGAFVFLYVVVLSSTNSSSRVIGDTDYRRRPTGDAAELKSSAPAETRPVKSNQLII